MYCLYMALLCLCQPVFVYPYLCRRCYRGADICGNLCKYGQREPSVWRVFGVVEVLSAVRTQRDHSW
jgi:hypothetical protein